MRQLKVNIQPRAGTSDLAYIFNSQDTYSPASPYQFVNLVLNYSVVSSSVTSMLILGMSTTLSENNVLRSGQPVTVEDNGVIVFQGVILTPTYKLLPMSEDSKGGLYAVITLAPSLYQLTLMPMIFDDTQAAQIKIVTGVDVSNFLAGNTVQLSNTQDLLNYMVLDTDYSTYFDGRISADDLGKTLFVMATAETSRDTVLRQSIDYYNCILYQQEDGLIVIRQLDPSFECPFDIDLANNIPAQNVTPETVPIAPLLTYEYMENAYSTPAAVSNYAMLAPDLAVAALADQCVLTYAPNPIFFPRIKQLQMGGWFVGQIGGTQINSNIASDPNTAAALAHFQSYQDQYMITTQASGVKDQATAAYQALLTAKQMGAALSGYSGLSFTISLDDPNIATADLSSVVGTCLQIQNCDMKSGLIATVSRSYSSDGSYLSGNIVPLGSYTGYWKNSKFQPA